MAGAWNLLQDIASVTRHLKDIQQEQKDLRRELQHDFERLEDEAHTRLRVLEDRVMSLEAHQATTRESIRAEIAIAVSDLRVRYAEEQARRQRPPLEDGPQEES
jgi:hypothetical protein